jgi:hypothetical protein
MFARWLLLATDKQKILVQSLDNRWQCPSKRIRPREGWRIGNQTAPNWRGHLQRTGQKCVLSALIARMIWKVLLASLLCLK